MFYRDCLYVSKEQMEKAQISKCNKSVPNPKYPYCACVLHSYVLNVEGEEWNEDFEYDEEDNNEEHDEFEEVGDNEQHAFSLRDRIANAL
ncbi:hypothetical protein DAPPUDRAFT_324810 [Daphnia pulex]|uniref:Uncharacterized protein n=1 Tax=Daphnia pulex TaxID=6669 RepID=E9H2S6_DAPPU|nr:hypothetical protein DAPPUDRAFT_324810 [Daphnia pulex]|eukprot:EFX73958.1 hypothetical protein DAPPUDRAFT_324810 [Daphnia pulex]